jgi:CBS domain-containing protein
LNIEAKIGDYFKRDPIIVAPETSLRDVARMMAEGDRDVVVVRDGEGVVQGLVTANDLFAAMVSSALGKDLLEQIPVDLRDVEVGKVMKRTRAEEFMEVCGLTGAQLCISLRPEDTVANAIRVMAMAGIDHILITSPEGVIGTLSDKDLVKVFKD